MAKFAPPGKEMKKSKFAPPGDDFAAPEAEEGQIIDLPESEPGLNETGELGGFKKAAGLGLASGASLGYADRLNPKRSKELSEAFPVTTTAAKVTGGIAPGGTMVKGLAALSKIPGLSSLATSGPVQGAIASGVEGLASDPGEGGSRLNRGMSAAGMGLGLGGLAKVAGTFGKRYDLYKRLHTDGLAKSVRAEIEQAMEQLLDRTVRPNSKKIQELLKNSGKNIKVNPDTLKGFNEPGLVPGTKTRGLDRLAEVIAKRRTNPNAWMGGGAVGANTGPNVSDVEIPALQAQKLKQRLDKMANYKKPAAFKAGGDAIGSANEKRASEIADRLRGRLADINGVSELNEVSSAALGARKRMLEVSKNNPISALTKDPLTATDRAQELLDLDKIGGTSLFKRGQELQAAKDLGPGDTGFNKSGYIKQLLNATKRGTGAVGSKLDKLPEGTKESLIQKLLDISKRPYSEEK